MILQFADKTELAVNAVRGGQQFVQNANRDVLTIEVPVESASFDNLRAIFQDRNKTKELCTIMENEDGDQVRNSLGMHYTLYLSVTNEQKEIIAPPGSVEPPEYREVNTVRIAQLTYTEYQLEQILAGK
jgi:hypothetical protein